MDTVMERHVVSKKRVADHGQVYTRKREVNAMLDLVRQETERIESRFLEPAFTMKDRFSFVPILPMTKVWTDQKLYVHFGLSEDEIAFIESMVRPMEAKDE
jgi:hypothetical protein